jgi:hypothetical protein
MQGLLASRLPLPVAYQLGERCAAAAGGNGASSPGMAWCRAR